MNNCCKNCGVEIKEDKKFCPNCGFQLKEDTKIPIPKKNYSNIEKILAFVGFIIGIIIFIILIIFGIKASFDGIWNGIDQPPAHGFWAFYVFVILCLIGYFPIFCFGGFLIYNFIHNFANTKIKKILAFFGFIIGIIIFIAAFIIIFLLLKEAIDENQTFDDMIRMFLAIVLSDLIVFSPILCLGGFSIYNYMHNFKKKNKN